MHSVTINDRVEEIKGKDQEINRFVEEYKPFIAACVEKASGRYVRYGVDDELSIGLMAFVEAIKAFASSKGNFLSFAQNVINRRLIDYYRKENKHSRVISIHEYISEDGEEQDLTEGQSLEKFSQEEISEYRRLELEQLKRELEEWDISFLELVAASPKQGGTRKIYNEIVRFLMTQAELLKQLKGKKYLPIAEIEKSTGIPRKKIERARKYIIAVIIIRTGDYQYIEDYVKWG